LLQYDVPILNQQGEISGLLKIKLQRIDGFGTPEVYESKNEECVEKIFSQNIEAPEHQSIEQGYLLFIILSVGLVKNLRYI